MGRTPRCYWKKSDHKIQVLCIPIWQFVILSLVPQHSTQKQGNWALESSVLLLNVSMISYSFGISDVSNVREKTGPTPLGFNNLNVII